MTCTCKVRFPAEGGNIEAGKDDSTDDEEVLDDESLWEDLDHEAEAEVLHVIDSNCQKQLSCFAHIITNACGGNMTNQRFVI